MFKKSISIISFIIALQAAPISIRAATTGAGVGISEIAPEPLSPHTAMNTIKVSIPNPDVIGGDDLKDKVKIDKALAKATQSNLTRTFWQRIGDGLQYYICGCRTVQVNDFNEFLREARNSITIHAGHITANLKQGTMVRTLLDEGIDLAIQDPEMRVNFKRGLDAAAAIAQRVDNAARLIITQDGRIQLWEAGKLLQDLGSPLLAGIGSSNLSPEMKALTTGIIALAVQPTDQVAALQTQGNILNALGRYAQSTSQVIAYDEVSRTLQIYASQHAKDAGSQPISKIALNSGTVQIGAQTLDTSALVAKLANLETTLKAGATAAFGSIIDTSVPGTEAATSGAGAGAGTGLFPVSGSTGRQ